MDGALSGEDAAMEAGTFRRRGFLRRDFLATSAFGALTLAAGGLAGCATSGGPAGGATAASAPPASAAELLSPRAAASLTEMARRLYPHDALDDAVYAEVVDDLVGAAAADPDQLAMLAVGAEALETAMTRTWLSLTEIEQVQVMERLEGSTFFATMHAGVMARLYERPDVWALVGYGGPALPQGGYLDKGFDAIDWLPA